VKNRYCRNYKKINREWPVAKSQTPDSGTINTHFLTKSSKRAERKNFVQLVGIIAFDLMMTFN
jgi:hypothetical protein